MTTARSLIAAVALAGCAAPATLPSSTTIAPTTYRLCSDPQFESMCTPAALERPAPAPDAPIQIDTNFKLPAAKRVASLG